MFVEKLYERLVNRQNIVVKLYKDRIQNAVLDILAALPALPVGNLK